MHRDARAEGPRSGIRNRAQSPMTNHHETNHHENQIQGLIFDFGGVLWDMRWDISLELEREHGLSERVIARTLFTGETWQRIEVGDGDRDAWLRGAHAQLETAAGH